MERPTAHDRLARDDRFVRMRARGVGDAKIAQGVPAHEITHAPTGSRRLARFTEADPQRRRRA